VRVVITERIFLIPLFSVYVCVTGTHTLGGQPTVSETLKAHVDRYFVLNQRIRDEKTRKQYRFAFKDFTAALGREPALSDLTDDNVVLLMAYLQRKKLAPKTINERRGRINAFWSWLSKRGILHTWPTTPPIPEPERIPMAWSPEQINQLFKCIKEIHGTIALIRACDWWHSLHLALWDTGERITALVQCEWSHLSGSWLVIPAELRKGRRKDKSYDLHPDTLAAIEIIRDNKREKIWPWPYCEAYLWSRYKTIRQKFGLPTDRKSSFHRMRKSVATHFEAAGGNATELLSHTSRKVTQSYLDPRFLKTPQAKDKLFRPAS
jgi:integrase